MYCQNCGKELERNASFCSECDMALSPLNMNAGDRSNGTEQNVNLMVSIEKIKRTAGVVISIAFTILLIFFATTMYECDRCGRLSFGTAYKGSISGNSRIYCRSCAVDYWYPLDVDNFKYSSYLDRFAR